MAKNETLHIRVNNVIKLRAEKTLDVLGLSISEAVNMLLHQISLLGGLPFEVRIPAAPESLVISSNKDLYEKLGLASVQIKEGKTVAADVVMARLSDRYGFQD